MSTQSAISIGDPTFNDLLKQATERNKAIPVRGSSNTEGCIISKQQYAALEKIRQDEEAFDKMVHKVQAENAHLDSEQIDDELLNITMDIRYNKQSTP